MNLNFTISELVKSDVAKQHGIRNMPQDPQILDNLLLLIINVLQPLRNYVGKPIIITSGYRSKELNFKVGGVANSEHLTGCAVDFIVKGMTVIDIIKAVRASGIRFNQCINEYNQWCHISFNKNGNKQQYLNI